MLKSNTHYTRVRSKPEINDGITRVEKSGYIPAKTRIEQFIRAGVRLNDYKKEMFDTDIGYQDWESVNIDPTRSGNYDMVDAQRDLESANQRIRARAEERSKAIKASQKPQEASRTSEPGPE